MASSGDGGRGGLRSVLGPNRYKFVQLHRINVTDISTKALVVLVALGVVLVALGVVAAFAFDAYVRATCKNGHEVSTGRMWCHGTEGSMLCEPETQFVCND